MPTPKTPELGLSVGDCEKVLKSNKRESHLRQRILDVRGESLISQVRTAITEASKGDFPRSPTQLQNMGMRLKCGTSSNRVLSGTLVQAFEGVKSGQEAHQKMRTLIESLLADRNSTRPTRQHAA